MSDHDEWCYRALDATDMCICPRLRKARADERKRILDENPFNPSAAAIGAATFEVCDRMAARLVAVICEQDRALHNTGVKRRYELAALRRSHGATIDAMASFRDALHLIDDLVGQIELLRSTVWGWAADADNAEQERDNAIAERDAAHQEVAELRKCLEWYRGVADRD